MARQGVVALKETLLAFMKFGYLKIKLGSVWLQKKESCLAIF